VLERRAPAWNWLAGVMKPWGGFAAGGSTC